jgi:xylulokinase
MYLGIDCGTQGTKALVTDASGKPLGRGYAPHELIERSNGAREQQPQWWVDALRASVKQAVAEATTALGGAPEVLALGVSGQQHGLVVLDEALQVIRPAKLWNDTQTAPENDALVERLGGSQACLERMGIIPLTGYTVSKLVWLKEHEPESFARIRHVLLPHEYLNFWLTGKMAAEFGDASGTGYFDVRSRTWSEDVLREIDGGTGQLLRALPPLLSAEEIAGTLRAEVAAELGLPAGCLVSAGGGDNMMGAIGTGNVKEGVVTLSLGTSSTVYSFREGPSSAPNESVAPFCASSGGWLPLVCTMNATNVVTQTLTLLGKTVADIEAALEATQPGADGLCFLPFLNGERTPNLPTARGTLTGVSANNFTPANLVRAAIEGVSFGVLNGLDLILEGGSPEVIVLIGGGARSPQWRQLLADATGAVIQVPTETEAGCLGAAMQAMYAYGHAAGRPERFAEIASRCVRLEGGDTATPRLELKAAYARAREVYAHELARIYLEA